MVHGTDPRLVDTDGDGLTDGEELEIGTQPLLPDSDLDSLNDGLEINVYGSDPMDGTPTTTACSMVKRPWSTLAIQPSWTATAMATGWG